MATAKINNSVKALKAHMATEKKVNYKTLLEWQMAHNTNSERGKVWNQEELCDLYSRSNGGHCGATKRTHTISHEGFEFNYIVIKRYKTNGWQFNGEGTGNQLIDEIECWQKLAATADADCLCPILKYFTCKSDKVTAISDTMKNRVLIIAQKAVYVDDLEGACKEAERMNRNNGYNGESAKARTTKLLDLAKRMKWRDVEYNPGNSGVIFDYEQNCYKAVFIDYAL